MLIQAFAAFLIIRWYGERNMISPASEIGAVASGLESPRASHTVDTEFHVLVTLSTVIGLGYLLGQLLRPLGQPPVVGEVIAGICLGPSILGASHPSLMHQLIPPSSLDPEGIVITALKMIGELGVLLYMFIVGLELNLTKLKHRAGAAVVISHVSVAIPFLGGALLALWLHPQYFPQGVGFTSASLFLGIAMSITAFPVLARILTDRNLQKTPLGMLALACAAADDATAWCLLAIVIGIVRMESQSALIVCLAAGAYVAVMLTAVRPALAAWCQRLDRQTAPLSNGVLAAACVGALCSGLITRTIGIHAIFGAFVLGAVIPSDSKVAKLLQSRLRDSVTVLLLPAYFAFTGMRTQIGLVSGASQWIAVLAIIAVATIGKLGGTVVAARCSGIGWRDSAALGTLMNTRGLMELIVLNIGLDLGIVSQTLFAMMVLMTLATTISTSPILALLAPESLKTKSRSLLDRSATAS